jgi:hypothetical protein
MTAGTIDQKAAKTDVAKWEALVLDTAQFYDRAERLLNSKGNRSPRNFFSNAQRNRPTRRNGYTKKNSYANSSSGATRTTYRGTQQTGPKRCHVCNSLGHLKKDFPKLLRSSPSSKPRNNFLNNKLKKSGIGHRTAYTRGSGYGGRGRGNSFQTQKEISLLGAMATLRKIVMPIIQVVLLGKHIGAPSKKGLGGAMYVTA